MAIHSPLKRSVCTYNTSLLVPRSRRHGAHSPDASRIVLFNPHVDRIIYEQWLNWFAILI